MQKLFKLKRYSYVEFLLVSWKEFIYVYAILFLSRCTVLCANMYTLYISLYADAKIKKNKKNYHWNFPAFVLYSERLMQFWPIFKISNTHSLCLICKKFRICRDVCTLMLNMLSTDGRRKVNLRFTRQRGVIWTVDTADCPYPSYKAS